MGAELTHLDPEGRPRMVDVSNKQITRRRAVAAGCLELGPAEARALENGGGPKGDPWFVARIGAIQGAKRASELIPLTHPVPLDSVLVEHYWDGTLRKAWLRVEACTEAKTGVEMEALAGVTAGLLTLYDMLKAVGQDMALGPVRLLLKEGGRRGTVTHAWDACPWNA